MPHPFLRLFVLLLVPAAAWGAVDPFAGVVESSAAARPSRETWARAFFRENFGFRKELMSQVAASQDAPASSRQSLGFEVLKKFSTETATIASVNFQGRVVRRDRFTPVQNDMEGMRRRGWAFEHHNAYLDLYGGRVNFRAGRFYVPFGLNLQTDTHGTLLQLSNERNFGFERDWYSGFWGELSDDLHFDAAYLAGSGYDLKSRGQSGLASGRLGLAGKYAAERGLEGGLSALGSERLSEDGAVVATRRAGLDGRWRRAAPAGLLTLTSEVTGGRDDADAVVTQLYQADYLRASRRWGLASQYRRFWRDGGGADGSLIGEATWYFRNDLAGSNLHWIKANVERKLERAGGGRDVIVALQYYRYW